MGQRDIVADQPAEVETAGVTIKAGAVAGAVVVVVVVDVVVVEVAVGVPTMGDKTPCCDSLQR